MMEKISKRFCNFNMTWFRVIVFAVISAVYTALINEIPFLKNTSFQDIAIAFECWILFAVFIIINCKSYIEAAAKCFVFFLISQPLIYLIEVPFETLGWGIFMYYKRWFIYTLLTIPGAIIAYQVKRKNWFSVAVLSIANAYLACACIGYFRSACANFPNHLLSSVFCIALALFFVFTLLKKKSHKIVAVIVIVAFLIFSLIITVPDNKKEIYLDDGTWTYTVDNGSVVSVEITDGNHAIIKAKHDGNDQLVFENSNGEREIYDVTVYNGNLLINKWD